MSGVTREPAPARRTDSRISFPTPDETLRRRRAVGRPVRTGRAVADVLRVQHCAVANDQIETRTAGDAFECLRHGSAWSRLKGLAEAHGAFARIELTHFPDAHVTHGL